MHPITLLKTWLQTLFFGTFPWFLIFYVVEIIEKNSFAQFSNLLEFTFMVVVISLVLSLPTIGILFFYNTIKASNNTLNFDNHLKLYLILSIITIVMTGFLMSFFAIIGVNYLLVGLFFTFKNRENLENINP